MPGADKKSASQEDACSKYGGELHKLAKMSASCRTPSSKRRLSVWVVMSLASNGQLASSPEQPLTSPTTLLKQMKYCRNKKVYPDCARNIKYDFAQYACQRNGIVSRYQNWWRWQGAGCGGTFSGRRCQIGAIVDSCPWNGGRSVLASLSVSAESESPAPDRVSESGFRCVDPERTKVDTSSETPSHTSEHIAQWHDRQQKKVQLQ
jgi:hypothetical protein